MNISNKFTATRIFVSPLLFALYFLPEWTGAKNGSVFSAVTSAALIPILAFAELTDFFDGLFARRRGQVSDFGKIFDPFADVFLHLSMFACFLKSGYMHAAFFALILYRELAQNFLRMASIKKGSAIAARKGGKIKTVFYVASCFAALAQNLLLRTGLAEFWSVNMRALNIACQCVFAACVVLAYASFFDYLKKFGGVLKDASE